MQFRKAGPGQRGGSRRQITEVHPRQPPEGGVAGNLTRSGEALGQRLPGTIDEAVEPLLLPPIEAAESGNNFYTTQPYQLLSWYPR